MFQKDLFDRICNVSCSWDELKEFVADIDQKEFDLENPFEKYYSVDSIISAIEKYQGGETDAQALASWMNAYRWIIMGGFQIEKQDKGISLKDFLIGEIVDWIDSLSFFDGNEDIYNLQEYKKRFQVFNTVWQGLELSGAEYAPLGYDEYGVIVLIVNDAAKYFIQIYGELDYENVKIDIEKTAAILLADREKKLLDAGYKKLKYRNFTEEDLS